MGSSATKSKLFMPLHIGPYQLSSRLVMAPLTRFRADDEHIQLPFVKDYYTQRACVPGTLIITEATVISPRAGGYRNVPGIWSLEQIKVWKQIVQGVHESGGVIFLQLWAIGRVAKADVKNAEGTGDVVSSSELPANSESVVPRALREEEVEQYIHDFAIAAKNAVEDAGFDGVEIHGANGYLIDQFTQDVVNQRTDRWGGSIENRARFALEVAKAVVNAVGARRTAIRLSPWSLFQGMGMIDPVPQFTYLVNGLKELGLAYIHLVEPLLDGNANGNRNQNNDLFIKAWGKTSPVLLNGGFSQKTAREAVDERYKDIELAIVFGRHFLANPDLVYRLRNGIEFQKYDRKSFYTVGSPEGYIDYPFSEEWQSENRRKLDMSS